MRNNEFLHSNKRNKILPLESRFTWPDGNLCFFCLTAIWFNYLLNCFKS